MRGSTVFLLLGFIRAAWWNILLHIVLGFLVYSRLTWTLSGLLQCAFLTAISQGVDMIRIYVDTITLIRSGPPDHREEMMATFKKRMPIIFPQMYVGKILSYGLLTLVAASITRAIVG